MRPYRLSDEPQPSALARIAVRPLWPLLGVMFAGPWLSWPWFILNGFAVGSPTRLRELAVAAAGFLVSAVFAGMLWAGFSAQIVPTAWLPYLITLLVVWHLTVSYALYALQARTFGIYEYYGGVVQNGLPILAAAFLIDGRLLSPLLRSTGDVGRIFGLILGI